MSDRATEDQHYIPRGTTMSASSMRAVQAVKAGSAFVLTSLPVPEPGPGQVRIKVYACGVCGGENVARLGLLGVQLPRVPGREIVGVIDAVGPGGTVWKKSERGGVVWYCSGC